MNLPRPVLLASGFAIVGVIALALQDVVVPWGAQFWGLLNNQIDLAVYRQGAQAVTEGADLYDVKMIGDLDYTYSPFSALLFTPLAWISFDVARWLWTAGIVVALYLVVMLSFRSLGRPVTWPLRVIAMSLVAVAMLLEPVRTTIWYGQINVFLMLLILADLTRPDTSRTKGIGAGIAAGIKLTPLIFAGYYAVQRNWRAFFGVIGGFVMTVAIGFIVLPRDSWAYWTGKLFDSERVGSAQLRGNQSIRGMLANHLDTDDPSTLLWAALVLTALVAGFAVATYAHRKGQELVAISIVGMTACVVSPMSWGHHWVWFVPIVVVGVHLALDARRAQVQRGLAAACAAALVLLAFAWPTHVPSLVPDAHYTGLYVKTRVVWLNWFTVSPYLWAYLGILIATVVALRVFGSRTAAPSDPAAVIAPGVAASVIADGGLPSEQAGSGSSRAVEPSLRTEDVRVTLSDELAADLADDLVGTAGEPLGDAPETGASPAV
ncbi:glycosyltransferase 87 family protein [Gordonia westfalica]|uniref:Alpha-1,2-mannosyltransferase n=1 Tax=Gordonia westfalica TaxID=158898 RepID=A0A1H2KN11_9ACTN|nr:glycosyltransferase 87 family protein [Gordonia westfalica]SDU69848.1 alpha-1,2-mannosyltransferase [Gordonia westfalica]